MSQSILKPSAARLLFLAAAVALFAATGRGAIVQEDYRPRRIFIFNTSGVHDAEEPYLIVTDEWRTQINAQPFDLPRGGTDLFLSTLRNTYGAAQGWTYATAAQDLSDSSLRIHTYDAVGSSGLVGAEFDLEYVPTPGTADPTLNVHWIQAVFDNHARSGTHGTPESVIDKFIPDGAPYYDTGGGAADGRNLYDFPRRGDGNLEHSWYASLYLVTGPPPGSPGLVTIYNGIGWGWSNVPEPSTIVILLAGGALAFWFRGRGCV